MTEEGSNESNWFQDNLRIIISVGIVILLVFAIYSYSKRTARTDVVVDDSQIEEVAMTAESENSKEINEILDEIKDEEQEQIEEVTQEQQEAQEKAEQEQKEQDEKQTAEEDEAEAEKTQQNQKIAQEQQEAQEKAEQEQKEQDEKQTAEEDEAQKIAQAEAEKLAEQETQNTQSAKDAMREVIESHSTQTQQKDGVIIVVAIPGDSTTTLARKATADYISRNNIGGLTPAHKIYIEDYMRKTKGTQNIHPGTELEFSNDLINSAIEKSRALTDAQLQNLDRYAQNVSTF